jgi:hypothetical protein
LYTKILWSELEEKSRKFLEDMSILLIREKFEEVERIQVSVNRKNHLSTNAEEFLSIWRIKE